MSNALRKTNWLSVVTNKTYTFCLDNNIIYTFKKYLSLIFIYLKNIYKAYNYVTNIVNKKLEWIEMYHIWSCIFIFMFVGLKTQIIIAVFQLINTQK